MRRLTLGGLAAVLLAFAAVPAGAQRETAFPRIRAGLGGQPISGGGVVAGDPYVTRSAVIAWSRRWSTLTLYLFWRRGATCANFRVLSTKPGHVIQVFVTKTPSIGVGPVASPQVAFATYYRDAHHPPHVDGLKNGAKLTFTHIDTYPHGVWNGTFEVPLRSYANGRKYGYNGTFRASWCQVAR